MNTETTVTKGVITEGTVTRRAWKESFASLISDMIGYPLKVEDIHSDEVGWGHHIMQKSLLCNFPLLLIHYCGPLFAVIPYRDYERLENGVIDPKDYIDKSRWCYGKYLGSGDILTGVFWKPLEICTGINKKEKISEYLEYLGSKHDVLKEITDKDYRQSLFKEMEINVRAELNLNITNLWCYDGKNALIIPSPSKKDDVALYLPTFVMNELLYFPGERDWKEYARYLNFELRDGKSEKRYIMKPTFGEKPSEQCRRIWKDWGIIDEWYKVKKVFVPASNGTTVPIYGKGAAVKEPVAKTASPVIETPVKNATVVSAVDKANAVKIVTAKDATPVREVPQIREAPAREVTTAKVIPAKEVAPVTTETPKEEGGIWKTVKNIFSGNDQQ